MAIFMYAVSTAEENRYYIMHYDIARQHRSSTAVAKSLDRVRPQLYTSAARHFFWYFNIIIFNPAVATLTCIQFVIIICNK